MREEFYEEWEPGEREHMSEKENPNEGLNENPGRENGFIDHSNDYPPTLGSPEYQNPLYQNLQEQNRQAEDPLTRYRNGSYQRPMRSMPEDNRFVRTALMMGLFSLTLAMMGCCMNVYILFGAAIASIAGMVTAILSKTGRRMHPNAAAGMVLSVVAMLITLFTVCSYSFMISHPELLDEAMRMYESMGLLPSGT